jgi:putative membrane protein
VTDGGTGISVASQSKTDRQLPAETTTQLAKRRTDLALLRSYMAAERTLQAWIRTALSMITFGFTIGKLGQAAEQLKVTSRFFDREWSVGSIAYALVSLGTVALLCACAQHWLDLRRLRAQGLRRRPGLALIIAALLAVVGGFALGALVLQL